MIYRVAPAVSGSVKARRYPYKTKGRETRSTFRRSIAWCRRAVNRSALTTILLSSSLLFYARIIYVHEYYDVLLRKISRQHNITFSRRVGIIYKSARVTKLSSGSLGPDNWDDPPGRVYNNRHDAREVLRARIYHTVRVSLPIYIYYIYAYLYMPTIGTYGRKWNDGDLATYNIMWKWLLRSVC